VQEATVVRDGDGFYGFIVPGDTGTLPLEQLPRRVKSRVLEAGVPLTGVSVLGALPRTATGEINASILQVPAERALEPAPVKARKDVTEALITDWQEILDADEVTRDCHFFDLGGHSVLVLRQLARIRDRWGVRLDVTAVYENPTLTELSRLVTMHLERPKTEIIEKDWRFMTLGKGGDRQSLIAINNAATGQALSRIGDDKRTVFCARVSEGDRGLTVTDETFEEIAAIYADVIRKGQPMGPYFLYGNCVHGNLALETARVLQSQGCEIAGVVMKDVWEPGYTARILGNKKSRKAEKWFTVRSRLKAVREGEMSWGTFLRFYGLAHKLKIIKIGEMFGFFAREHENDLNEAQQAFISDISRKRNEYRPGAITFPVLHIVTEITPTGKGFMPSVGWEDVVEDGKLKTVPIDKVMVLENRKFGIDKMAAEIEGFLGER